VLVPAELVVDRYRLALGLWREHGHAQQAQHRPESNDLVLQLRKRGVNQVILAGMAANLCVEGHLRELIEQGFEVAVVKDATAGARLPEGDGYLAALVNLRFLASAVSTTAEAVNSINKEAESHGIE
jgi:nicotinamidase-related amidase